MIEMVPRPRLIDRKCGGVLAVSPKYARFRIGVTAETRAQAEYEYWRTYVRWCEIVPFNSETD